jgi:WD40 repeat protein
VRKDSIDSRSGETLAGRLQKHSTHVGLVTWQEMVFLTIAVVTMSYLLGEPDHGGKNRVRQMVVEHDGPIRSIMFRPDGAMLLSVGVDGFTVVWHLEGSQKRPFPVATLDQVRRAVFSADSKVLATLNLTGAITVHDLISQSSRVLYQPRSAVERANCLAFSPDSNTLAIGRSDGQIGLWDVDTGQNQQMMDSHTNFIVSLAFSPVSSTLVFSSGDRSVRLWDLANGQQRLLFRDQMSTVTVLAFSPGGQFLAMGNHVSPTIRLWDIRAGRERMPLQGLSGNLIAVAVNDDASTLAAAGFNGLVRFWDLQTLKIASTQLRHPRVCSLAFAPDGHTLATGGFDGTIQLWDWPDCTSIDAPQPVAASGLPVDRAHATVASAQAGTNAAKRPAASVQAAVSRGS